MGSTAKTVGAIAAAPALGAIGAMSKGGLRDTLFGGVQRKEDVQLLTPQQQQLLSSTLQSAAPAYQQSLQQFLQPSSPEMDEAVFEKSFVAPAQQLFAQKLQPQIMQQFGDVNAASSSALNQALGQAAADLSTSMGSQYANYLQSQQQQRLQAMGLLQQLLGQQTFQPMFQQQQGILGPLIGTAGQLGAAYLGG